MAPAVLAGAPPAQVRLGLVADVQYADRDPGKTRFYRDSLRKLSQAVECFNRLDLDACLNLGDLVDQDWASFDRVLEPLNRCRHRVYHLLGNHDFEVSDSFKPQVPRRLGLKRRFDSLTRGEFCLVRLDTNDLSGYAYPAQSKETAAAKAMLERLIAVKALNAQPWNGAVGSQQLAWFERTCLRARRAGRKVVVFAHHPIFPADPHNTWNAAELLGILDRHSNVVAWINGHNHAGAFGLYQGVPCVTLKGMVETADQNAFAELVLRSDRLEIVGHGREPSREVPWRRAV